MLRDEIAPALRRLGFKGSGQTFALRSDTHWALLGFQISRDSFVASVKFTVNVTVVAHQVWKVWREASPHLPLRPHANVSYGPGLRQLEADVRAGYWFRRIGLLMPTRNDHWWEVTAGSGTMAIAADVLGAIQRYAVPEMRRRIDG